MEIISSAAALIGFGLWMILPDGNFQTLEKPPEEKPENVFGSTAVKFETASSRSNGAEGVPEPETSVAIAPVVRLSARDEEEIRKIIQAETAFLEDGDIRHLKPIYGISLELLWSTDLENWSVIGTSQTNTFYTDSEDHGFFIWKMDSISK